MNPKVSIITPTHNHQRFIYSCVESVLNQTYTNWEQIIIDDASSDFTVKIASQFAQRDKRIKIIKHFKKWGINRLSDTYNQALKKAAGKYVAILEGDDYWPYYKLEKQIKGFKDSSVVLSFGDCIMTDEVGRGIKLFTYNLKKRHLQNSPKNAILELFTNLDFCIIPATVVIRKSALDSIGGFKKNTHYPFTDIPTFLHLSLAGNFSYKKGVLGFYRKQKASAWFDFVKDTAAMGRQEIQQCVNEFMERNKDNPKVKRILLNKRSVNSKQKKFILKKKKLKRLSLLLNRMAFKEDRTSLLPIIFSLQYFLYKLKKTRPVFLI